MAIKGRRARAGEQARALGSETELSSAVREALNLQPGVRVRRNNSGRLQDLRGRWVAFGQGLGSPDLMGAVTMLAAVVRDASPLLPRRIARCFHVEIKLPGKEATTDQLAWHAEARSRGEFVAVVRSVAEALAALERCRRGGSE